MSIRIQYIKVSYGEFVAYRHRSLNATINMGIYDGERVLPPPARISANGRLPWVEKMTKPRQCRSSGGGLTART